MALKWLIGVGINGLVGKAEDECFEEIKQKWEANAKAIQPNKDFQMPLNYPRYRKEDYEKMEEWKLDLLLAQYGLSFIGSVDEKREFAIGTFLWPDQV